MDEWRLHMTMIWVLFALSFISFIVLMFIPAPYGRHVTSWVGSGDSGASRLDRDGSAGRARLRLGVFRG